MQLHCRWEGGVFIVITYSHTIFLMSVSGLNQLPNILLRTAGCESMGSRENSIFLAFAGFFFGGGGTDPIDLSALSLFFLLLFA